MKISFAKLSSEQHSVSVVRQDLSTDTSTLDSRSFLWHDFAHLAVESELPMQLCMANNDVPTALDLLKHSAAVVPLKDLTPVSCI